MAEILRDPIGVFIRLAATPEGKMLIARTLFALAFGAAIVAGGGREGSFFELVEVDQIANFTSRNDRYTITIYTKKRKLELMAEHHRRLELVEEEKEELAKRVGNPAELQRLMPRVPNAPRFYPVTSVGKDFIGIALDDNRTLIIPHWSIKGLIFEAAAGEEATDGRLLRK